MCYEGRAVARDARFSIPLMASASRKLHLRRVGIPSTANPLHAMHAMPATARMAQRARARSVWWCAWQQHCMQFASRAHTCPPLWMHACVHAWACMHAHAGVWFGNVHARTLCHLSPLATALPLACSFGMGRLIRPQQAPIEPPGLAARGMARAPPLLQHAAASLPLFIPRLFFPLGLCITFPRRCAPPPRSAVCIRGPVFDDMLETALQSCGGWKRCLLCATGA